MNQVTRQKMADLCKALGLPPRVRRFSISYDFNVGVLEIECEHLANSPQEDEFVGILSKGTIQFDEETDHG